MTTIIDRLRAWLLRHSPPLVHTTLGHVPAASLRREVAWRITNKAITFSERYLTDDGTVVRQDSHVYAYPAEAQADASIV